MTVCEIGYGLDTDGKCVPCEDVNLVQCGQSAEMLAAVNIECINGFSLHGMYEKVCTKCVTENCDQCEVNPEQCTRCRTG